MKNKILILFAVSTLIFASCSENLLNRPDRNNANDETYWTSEINLRLFANGFYTNYFVGYNSSYTADYTPVRGMIFADDFCSASSQISFPNSVSSAPGTDYSTVYAGVGWYFAWVRKANLFQDRIAKGMKGILTTEAYNHWIGVARFFKAWEYCRLMLVFGDVPYFDDYITETQEDIMYKDRDSRATVVEKVMADFRFAFDNIRTDDGSMQLNKYAVAAAISRFMLYEGTFQKYYYNNNALAKQCLDFAIEAADFLITSNKYSIDKSFHELFGSQDLAGNKECILYRHYASTLVMHCIASYCNTEESQEVGPNLALFKSFICNDGKTYHNSTAVSSISDGEKFSLNNMIATRDPRFESTFYHSYYHTNGTALINLTPSLVYCNKFIDRVGTEDGYRGLVNPLYGSNTNASDAPVFRYGEVLLNWIEAKAEVATLGGAAVTQSDINKSINALRDRPLDANAIARGVQKTVHMDISSLPNDPDRDSDVSELIWEIRRERRMELAYEYCRLYDIKRWKKLDYMKTSSSPKFSDNMLGPWIDYNTELPGRLTGPTGAYAGVMKVQKTDGTIVVYNGSNNADMVGFAVAHNALVRNEDVSAKQYFAPIPVAQITLYETKGYTLTQSPGW
ncbi:MAG: RagB/SusD family nutrient uptake outer membrane protein [Prevotellaceae bacterium]|jgi:hypothetical protein|nr:RagB/SusD family nutrient uptake outer membrane protein [Prevotellaceae bacterium]